MLFPFSSHVWLSMFRVLRGKRAKPIKRKDLAINTNPSLLSSQYSSLTTSLQGVQGGCGLRAMQFFHYSITNETYADLCRHRCRDFRQTEQMERLYIQLSCCLVIVPICQSRIYRVYTEATPLIRERLQEVIFSTWSSNTGRSLTVRGITVMC